MKYTPPYTDEAERSCIRKAQTGDINSFGSLVEKYKSLLKAYCIDTLQCPFDRAEDIAHEAFCLAWENIGTYVYDAAFFKWLCTLAQSRYETACIDRNNQAGNLNINTGRDCVEKQLKQVRAEYRDIIDFVHLRDMGLKTVAGMLGVPVSTIKSRLALALKEAGPLLRKCV